MKKRISFIVGVLTIMLSSSAFSFYSDSKNTYIESKRVSAKVMTGHDYIEVDVLKNIEAGVALRETVDQGLCLEWITTALEAGWQYVELPKLMRIMFRESRCLPDACGETDSPHLRKCRDWGLMQINDYSWKRIIREMGMDIEQMHDPYWNLWFARWLFEYSAKYNDYGWQPWTPHKS